ncbi:unnamed protein product [Caenorhabditis auriculariae]|uniref:Uncharacterized protein n=1 Tax=Caenorhabditis auriculariae TaxID=2777116 RepID=A0A8S1HJR4_9PELO|nr:unnamed protein product [Caenorhabditis auriculariae]
MFTVLFFLAALSSGAWGSMKPGDEADVILPGNIVEVEAFGEGRCRDTTRWFNKHLMPMWEKFGKSSGRIKLRYHPFGVKSACTCTDDGDVSCECHHGERECLLNQLQSCVIDHLPKVEDHLPFVSCVQGRENVDVAAEICFPDGSVLKREEMMACATSVKGRELLHFQGEIKKKYAEKTHWVPWIMINGVRVREGENDLWQLLCDRYLKPRPAECPPETFY